MSLSTLHCFSGSYMLDRRPAAPNQPLQAWDAADEYLLETLASDFAPGQRMLIINDSFGALAVALHESAPHSWGDSFTAELALAENRERNGILESVTFVPSTHPPTGPYDVVLWRVPKSVALFQQQMVMLQPILSEGARVLVAGMVKHLPDQAREMLGQLGRVDIYPVQKKALLFRVTPQRDMALLSVPTEKPLAVPEYHLELSAGPNVFAREKFDIGTRFFLDQFAQLPTLNRIADLGCGNGVLGLVAKQKQPEAELYFFDESYQAVAAAEENYARNGLAESGPAAHFLLDDCLNHYDGEPFDLVLCNPPFHQSHVVGDQIAWQMFVQSRKHLRVGGELWIVGNRHLNYHIKLQRVFGNCRQIAAHPKFVVLAARRR